MDAALLEMAIASVAHLGQGADGPWENRTDRGLEARQAGRISYPFVAGWVNATYSVQLLQHPAHPGIDHILVRRHDEGADIGWSDLQKIKDRHALDGQLRWGLEVFPPRLDVVDNANLRHVWVMPRDWSPPIQLGEDVRC